MNGKGGLNRKGVVNELKQHSSIRNEKMD